jgi:Universal stress protein family
MWDGCSISSHSWSKRGSKRWGKKRRGENARMGWSKVEKVGKKRVVVVIDQSSGAKHAMMWALTHVTNKGDLLTLIHVMEKQRGVGDDPYSLVNSLGSLCKACKPEVLNCISVYWIFEFLKGGYWVLFFVSEMVKDKSGVSFNIFTFDFFLKKNIFT